MRCFKHWFIHTWHPFQSVTSLFSIPFPSILSQSSLSATMDPLGTDQSQIFCRPSPQPGWAHMLTKVYLMWFSSFSSSVSAAEHILPPCLFLFIVVLSTSLLPTLHLYFPDSVFPSSSAKHVSRHSHRDLRGKTRAGKEKKRMVQFVRVGEEQRVVSY